MHKTTNSLRGAPLTVTGGGFKDFIFPRSVISAPPTSSLALRFIIRASLSTPFHQQFPHVSTTLAARRPRPRRQKVPLWSARGSNGGRLTFIDTGLSEWRRRRCSFPISAPQIGIRCRALQCLKHHFPNLWCGKHDLIPVQCVSSDSPSLQIVFVWHHIERAIVHRCGRPAGILCGNGSLVLCTRLCSHQLVLAVRLHTMQTKPSDATSTPTRPTEHNPTACNAESRLSNSIVGRLPAGDDIGSLSVLLLIRQHAKVELGCSGLAATPLSKLLCDWPIGECIF